MQYLEEKYPEPQLFPKDEKQLQVALEWIELSSRQVRDVSHHLYWQIIEPPAEGADLQRIAELKQQGTEILQQLDETLAKTKWIMGDAMSVVDIAMIPWIYGYQRFDFPFETDFPDVWDWLTRLSKRDSFKDNFHKEGRPFFDESP